MPIPPIPDNFAQALQQAVGGSNAANAPAQATLAGVNGEIVANPATLAPTGSSAPTGSEATGSNQPWNLPMDDFLFQSGIEPLPDDMYDKQTLKLGLGAVGLSPRGDFVVNDHADGSPSILINSDRVIINSKSSHTIIAGADGVALTSPTKVNIDADESVTIFGAQGIYLGVPNKGERPAEYPDSSIVNPANPAFFKDGKKLKSFPAPDVPYEPMVLGLKLVNWLEDLLLVIKNQQILTPVGLGATREDAQWDYIALQSRLNELISDYIYIDGYSHEKPDFKSVPKPPEKVTKPRTSIEVNASVTITQATPTVGPVSSPNANKPGYYESNSVTTPSLKTN